MVKIQTYLKKTVESLIPKISSQMFRGSSMNVGGQSPEHKAPLSVVFSPWRQVECQRRATGPAGWAGDTGEVGEIIE